MSLLSCHAVISRYSVLLSESCVILLHRTTIKAFRTFTAVALCFGVKHYTGSNIDHGCQLFGVNLKNHLYESQSIRYLYHKAFMTRREGKILDSSLICNCYYYPQMTGRLWLSLKIWPKECYILFKIIQAATYVKLRKIWMSQWEQHNII